MVAQALSRKKSYERLRRLDDQPASSFKTRSNSY